jgi:predicted nucleic acid-binding protein
VGAHDLRPLRTTKSTSALRSRRHASLATGIWSLRNKLTAYDAAYVTLARLLNATLVTRDERLASAAALEVSVTVP